MAQESFNYPFTQHVSGGVAQLKPDQTPDQLISHCDKLLYQAKSLGRNRVIAD